MMKLSHMKKVVDTVDDQWESPLAEAILEHWGFDFGTVKYYRASANFVFVFRREGKRYFLRFNDSSARDINRMASEIALLQYFQEGPLHVAQPVISMNHRFIESVVYDDRTYYAVVFEALIGDQFAIEEIDEARFFMWGRALGKLHVVNKKIPKEIIKSRPTWQDHLAFLKEVIPETESNALRQLEQVEEWARGLSITDEHFGLIHYDFELDNVVWNGKAVSALDFDDSACYWFAADIAYALRDLFEEGIDLENPLFQAFINGYQSETDIDMALIEELPMFMRWHDLVSFAKLIRCVDIPESNDDPQWLVNLRSKLVSKIKAYRQSFVMK